MTRKVELPDTPVADLREYTPALRYACRLAREREAKHRRRVERIGFVVARRHRRELEELAERVREG